MSIFNEQISHQIDSLVSARDMLISSIDELSKTVRDLDDIAVKAAKEQDERRRLTRKGTLVI